MVMIWWQFYLLDKNIIDVKFYDVILVLSSSSVLLSSEMQKKTSFKIEHIAFFGIFWHFKQRDFYYKNTSTVSPQP